MSILSNIQLLLQKRVARKRGFLQSHIFNATISELSRDLISFATPWNDKLVPLINSLPELAGNDFLDAVSSGLDSRVLFVNHLSTSVIDPDNFNTTENRPLSVYEKIGEMAQAIVDLEQQVNTQIGAISVSASQVNIVDTLGLYTATEVEGALAEVRNIVNNLISQGFDLTAVASDYIPISDNVYSIGTTALRIKDLILGPGSLSIDSKTSDGANAVAQHVSLGLDLGATDPADAGNFLLNDNTGEALRIRETSFAPGRPLEIVKMTSAEIAALPITNGLIAYDTDLNKFMCVENSAWETLRSNTASGGSGWIFISDITPVSTSDSVTNKVWDSDPFTSGLQTCDSSTDSLVIHLEASYPNFKLNGVLQGVALTYDTNTGSYKGTASLTLSGGGQAIATTVTPDGIDGAVDTTDVTYIAPPQILSLSFANGYPVGQTELKAGDTYDVIGTSDIPVDSIQVVGAGASDTLQTFAISPANTSFSFTITIGSANSGLQDIQAKGRGVAISGYGPLRSTNQSGGSVDGSDVVNLNNTYPSIAFGAIDYPIGQQALKNTEVATFNHTVSNFDTISYTSPNGDLTITNPATYESAKTVQRLAGNYNVSVPNFEITATRSANGAVSVSNAIVQIAHVATVMNVILPAVRLISGGNDGTSTPAHNITISTDQNLLNAPSITPAVSGGTFLGTDFTGSGSTWTRQMNVHDTTDNKGVHTWGSPLATNLAGLATNVITSGSTYELGGFVARNVTFSSFSQSSSINVAVVDYTKLQAGIWTAKNTQSIRNPNQGDHSDLVDNYTVDNIGSSPTTVWWNDVTAAGSNSSYSDLVALEELP